MNRATANFTIYGSLGAIPVFLLWVYINWIIVLAGVFAARGASALVVHGDDGLDELTTTTTSTIWRVQAGTVDRLTLDPAAFGFRLIEVFLIGVIAVGGHHALLDDFAVLKQRELHARAADIQRQSHHCSIPLILSLFILRSTPWI